MAVEVASIQDLEELKTLLTEELNAVAGRVEELEEAEEEQEAIDRKAQDEQDEAIEEAVEKAVKDAVGEAFDEYVDGEEFSTKLRESLEAMTGDDDFVETKTFDELEERLSSLEEAGVTRKDWGELIGESGDDILRAVEGKGLATEALVARLTADLGERIGKLEVSRKLESAGFTARLKWLFTGRI